MRSSVARQVASSRSGAAGGSAASTGAGTGWEPAPGIGGPPGAAPVRRAVDDQHRHRRHRRHGARQVKALARAGSELVRITVNSDEAAAAVPHDPRPVSPSSASTCR
jgi:hypothetical protein